MPSPKVIYIIGASFSGSTILGALLGQQPDSICAGELGNWTLKKGSQDLPCSCGIIRRDCPFWSQVLKTWLGYDHPGWADYRNAQKRFERLRNVPTLGLERLLHPAEFETYAEITRRLYQTLRKVSGKDIIIEISKRVGRAQTLARIGELDVAYIHLVRDGRGFLLSSHRRNQKKMDQDGIYKKLSTAFLIRSSLEWVFTNRMAEKVIAESKRPALRVRYEDFAVDPIHALNRITVTLSVDLSTLCTDIGSGKPINFGHMGGGNKLRLVGPTLLRLEESMETATSSRRQ